MFRRMIRCFAIAFSLSALIAASSQAAPVRALPKESAPVVGSLVMAWEWLVSFLRGNTLTVVSRIQSTTANDTSHLDPNGNH
jgi:hypothetical protein